MNTRQYVYPPPTRMEKCCCYRCVSFGRETENPSPEGRICCGILKIDMKRLNALRLSSEISSADGPTGLWRMIYLFRRRQALEAQGLVA